MVKKGSDDGFIIDFWEKIFGFLGKISVFNLIRFIRNKKGKKNSYTFVDGWVLGNLVASITLSFVSLYFIKNKVVAFIIFTYAALRTFEIIIYQMNVLLFDPYRAKKRGKRYSIKSPLRMIISLLQNYVEIMFWYSTMIITILILTNTQIDYSWRYIIKSSFFCISTFDYNTVIQISEGQFEILSEIASFEVLSGLIMTVISLARFIGLLPDVTIKEEE